MIVENKTPNTDAGSLKYDKGVLKEISDEEKALKRQTKSWRSDYDVLYQMIKDDLLREKFIVDAGQKKEL